jgi:hypothetical protein
VNIVELTADTAEEFVAKQPVTAILFYTPGDHRLRQLMDKFTSLANSFCEYVAFGAVDVTAAENAEFLENGIVVTTPTVIYYRFGEPSGEDVGHKAITKRLGHDSLVHCYGHTDTWLKLLR